VLPRQEGFYLLTLAFRSQNGRLLGKYGQYLRILKSKVSAKLVLGPRIPVPGDVVYLQLVNTGTLHISYGEPFLIEEYSSSGWEPTAVELGPWHRILFNLAGGLAGRCQQFVVPSELAPGQYRLRKDIANPKMSVTAGFEVPPAGASRIVVKLGNHPDAIQLPRYQPLINERPMIHSYLDRSSLRGFSIGL
jgi:hypothetical protein